MQNRNEIVVYEWQAWTGFLFPSIFPHSTRLTACIGEWHSDVILRLPANFSLFVFHISLTHTASIPHHRRLLCEELMARDVTVLNADATNISKTFIQATCERLGLKTTTANREGDEQERLIIKTNWNFGGEAESSIPIHESRLLGLGNFSPDIDSRSYRILKRSEIPDSIWNRTDLVIEHYIENQRNWFYRAYWLARKLVISRVIDPAPIKKMPEGIERQSWFFTMQDNGVDACGIVDREIERLSRYLFLFIQETRIDFGAIDVVTDDSTSYYVIDVNTTPFWGGSGHEDIISFLRSGVRG
jgi:hypothetical protein